MVFLSTLFRAGGSAQSDLRLMDLNVVALDDHGRPVTDLTSDDFQISDAGKPQKISFFRRNGESSGQNQARASGPNQFSNRAGGGARNATVILFDLLNLGYGARAFAANEMVRNLGGIESADSLYLYLLSVNGKFFQVHGLSPGEVPAPQPPGVPWGNNCRRFQAGRLSSGSPMASRSSWAKIAPTTYVEGMTGRDAATYLRTKSNGLRVLMVGGLLDDQRLKYRESLEGFDVFPKPYSPGELLQKIKDVLAKPRGENKESP